MSERRAKDILALLLEYQEACTGAGSALMQASLLTGKDSIDAFGAFEKNRDEAVAAHVRICEAIGISIEPAGPPPEPT